MPTPFSQLSSAAALAALLFALSPVPGAAQVTADSAARAKPADSTVAGSGYNAGQAGVDTAQGKAAAESTAKAPKAPQDSVQLQAATPAPPADSVLTGACSSARPGTVAPGILLVLFRDSATQKERDSALTAAGGVVAGTAPSGGQYVKPSADTISSRDLADRLVQDAAIASISERSCPTGR
jgi:hypothetical protein